jgi:hypothetical protein
MHRSVFLVVGGFVILIGLALLFAPASYFQLYAVAYAAEMNFPAQRFAPAVVALGVVLICARKLEQGPFVGTLSLISAFAFLGVAATGVQARVVGTARSTILGAAALEIAVALVFLWLWSRIRNH